jgi:transposase-like protein
MYIKGVSTRDAEPVMKEFSIESLASTQVSQATNCWMMNCPPGAADPRAKYAI